MLRRFFTFLGSVILMLLLAIILLPFLFPIENYRSDILKMVQEKTGREVAIKGELDFTLLPNIALEVNEITIGNPEGFFSSYFADIKTLQLKMALWPLLKKQIEIDELAIQNAEIYLEEAVGGKKNWEFDIAKIQKTSSSNVKKVQKSDFRMDVSHITIEETKLHYIKPGHKFSTENLNLDYGENKSDLDLVLKHANTSYHLTLKTPDTHSLFESRETPLEVAMRSPLIRADFSGQLRGVDLSSGKLNAQLTGNLAASVLTIGKLNSRKFTADVEKASLGLLSVETSQGVSATGDMRVNYAGKRPHVTTTLAFPELDFDTLFKPVEPKQSWLPVVSDAYAAEPWSREPIDLSMLNSFDADAKLSVGKLKTSGYLLDSFLSSLKLNRGSLNISSFSANLLGGSVSGTGTVNSSGQWDKTVRLNNIPFEKIAAQYIEKSALTGTTNGSISLRSRGKSVFDWMHNLAGGGNLTISDGIIKGFSLPKLFRKAIGLNPDAVPPDPNENTPFSAIKTAFSVDKGIINLREGSLASNRLKADASGSISMAEQSVNLVLTPELIPQVEAQEGQPAPTGLMVPVKVKGSFDKIKVKPDYSRTIGNLLKDPKNIEDKLKTLKPDAKLLEDSFEPSKDAIKENWKDLKDTKNPEALKNIFNELDKNGVNPFNLLNGQN